MDLEKYKKMAGIETLTEGTSPTLAWKNAREKVESAANTVYYAIQDLKGMLEHPKSNPTLDTDAKMNIERLQKVL